MILNIAPKSWEIIDKKDNNNYLNRNIDIMKKGQKIKTNLKDPKNNEAIGNGPLTQNNYGGLNKINLDLQNQTNIQETLKTEKFYLKRIKRIPQNVQKNETKPT